MARFTSILTLVLLIVLAPRVEAQKPTPKDEDAKAEKKPDAKADPKPESDPEAEKKPDAKADPKPESDPEAEEKPDPDPESESTPEDKPAPKDEPDPPALPPTPSEGGNTQSSTSKTKPMTAPRGAIVVAIGPKAQSHARALARTVYQDAVLRPRIDESTAQVLSGGAAPKGNVELEGHASVIAALSASKSEDVQRRLAGSLARDLHVRLVVLVSFDGKEPTARLLRMPEERMLAVKLTARAKRDKKGTKTWDWSEATSMMRELAIGAPPPGPRKKKKDAGGTALPTPEDSEDDGNLLTSPWFWGGLGLVVTVGATVLILSQTALNEPDVVLIDGRVGP